MWTNAASSLLQINDLVYSDVFGHGVVTNIRDDVDGVYAIVKFHELKVPHVFHLSGALLEGCPSPYDIRRLPRGEVVDVHTRPRINLWDWGMGFLAGGFVGFVGGALAWLP